MNNMLNLVPQPFRQLLALISPATLKVISVKEVLLVSKKLIKFHKDKELDQGIRVWLRENLKNTHLVDSISEQVDVSELSLKEREATGEKILGLYFQQFLNPEGIFLDIRPARLSCNVDLAWNPNLAFRFSPTFREGILKLYRSFYGGDTEGFRRSLLQLQLIQEDWSHSQIDELSKLLVDHFGSSIDQKTNFSMDMFQESSAKLFDFLNRNRVEIEQDFLVFGLYLICLYLSLSELKVPLDVNAVVGRVLLDE